MAVLIFEDAANDLVMTCACRDEAPVGRHRVTTSIGGVGAPAHRAEPV